MGKAFVSLYPLGSTLRLFWSRVSMQGMLRACTLPMNLNGLTDLQAKYGYKQYPLFSAKTSI
jgi:hypothetical protein